MRKVFQSPSRALRYFYSGLQPLSSVVCSGPQPCWGSLKKTRLPTGRRVPARIVPRAFGSLPRGQRLSGAAGGIDVSAFTMRHRKLENRVAHNLCVRRDFVLRNITRKGGVALLVDATWPRASPPAAWWAKSFRSISLLGCARGSRRHPRDERWGWMSEDRHGLRLCLLRPSGLEACRVAGRLICRSCFECAMLVRGCCCGCRIVLVGERRGLIRRVLRDGTWRGHCAPTRGRTRTGQTGEYAPHQHVSRLAPRPVRRPNADVGK
jgi:hypothetical protein